MEEKKDLRFWLAASKTGKQLSEYHIKLLKRHKIHTAEEFVDAANVHTILALSCDETEEIKREILDLFVPMVKLKTLYQGNPKNYSTGIEEFDSLLAAIGQPFRPGRVWELLGEIDVGKTQLFYTLAVNFVGQHGAQHQVLFMDTNCIFESARLEQIMLERQLDAQAIDSNLDAINVVKVNTAESLIATLESLLEKLSRPNAMFEAVSRIKLILIDSLTACYILFRSGCDRNKGRRFVTELAMIMRKLAVQHGIAFIVANMTISHEDEKYAAKDVGVDGEMSSQDGEETPERDSLLGDYWSSVCTLTLALELPEESHSDGLRLLKVRNNSCGVSGGSCLLRITDAGVI